MRAIIRQTVARAAGRNGAVHGANIGAGVAGLPRRNDRRGCGGRWRHDAPPASVWGAATSVWEGRAPARRTPAPARPTPTPRPPPAPARPPPTPARPTPASEGKATAEAAIEATAAESAEAAVEPAAVEAASAEAAVEPAAVEAASAEAAVEPAAAETASPTLGEGESPARCETCGDKRCYD